MNTARFARRPVVCELDQCSELVATNQPRSFIMSKSFALAAFLTPEDIEASKPSTKRNVRIVTK